MMMCAPIFFLLIIPHAFSLPLSFSFSSFNPNDTSITYEGSASPVDSSIQLTTTMTNSSGRATYYQPMRLWDSTTGKLTDFTTHFSFEISADDFWHGDGMAFFLAPNGSKLANDSVASVLGLTHSEKQLNSADNPFVAVEFDIFQNEWDPSSQHVGIDNSSVKSVATLTWQADINGSRSNEANISYNSSTQNLSILFTNFNNSTTVWNHLQCPVDLKQWLHEAEWVTFGFSASTGGRYAIQKIKSWTFTSTLEERSPSLGPSLSPNPSLNLSPSPSFNLSPNPSLSLSPSPSLSLSPSPSPSKRTAKTKTILVVGLGIGGFVLICGLCLILLCLWKRWKNKKMEENVREPNEYMSENFERGTGPKKYTYAELASAANYFEDEQKLGQGRFGGVYRGFLKDSSSDVAIKKVSEASEQRIKEFASEVRIISELRHRNLVRLKGWCYEKKELLLVYEYMPNGSLDFHLFENQSLLTWAVRFKIAQGLASALLYLHEGWEQCVLHRDIKSSNIMLDSNFNAKLGDFGLARLVDHTKSAQTTALAGTMGYMAPEYVITGRASRESDVYSFGVVALEIACGRKPINHNALENEMNIVEWVWGLYGSGRILEAVDPRLCGDFDQQQIKCLMIVGLWCAHFNHKSRPSIRQVIQVLNLEAPLPNLPSSFSVLAYLEALVRPSTSATSSTNASEVGQN